MHVFSVGEKREVCISTLAPCCKVEALTAHPQCQLRSVSNSVLAVTWETKQCCRYMKITGGFQNFKVESCIF